MLLKVHKAVSHESIYTRDARASKMKANFSDLFGGTLSDHKGCNGKYIATLPGQSHVISVQIVYAKPALFRFGIGIVSNSFHTNTAVRLTLYESR